MQVTERGLLTTRTSLWRGIATATYLADFSRPKDVVRACEEILAAEPTLQVAVLNAGVWAVDPQVTLQEDGLEVHYATNFLQMALFVEMLAPLLVRSTPARFCVTGSYTAGVDPTLTTAPRERNDTVRCVHVRVQVASVLNSLVHGDPSDPSDTSDTSGDAVSDLVIPSPRVRGVFGWHPP
jgi:NAD(P)-dependent dehydrogenase (short-subunit alcohol dehydrogenase family)